MIKAQLFAMGTQRELVSTQLTYYRTANPKTGRSGPIPMGGLVTLAFVSGDGDDRLLRWITHSPKGELCTLTAAKIVFYEGDLDGSTLFAYQLHDAALVYWKEEFKATGTTPMMVTITISAAIQTIKGVTWIKPWRESRALSEEIATHKKRVQRGVSDDRRKEKDGRVLEGVVLETARTGTQFTKSNLKLGQQMHKAYKAKLHNPAKGLYKEFRLPSWRCIDFLDVNKGIIYELKPFNPRAMQAGQRQLQMYLKELQSLPQYKGINWKTVLDTY